MTAIIHRQPRPGHTAFVLASRALHGIGEGFRLAPQVDRSPKGQDPQGLGAKHESDGAEGMRQTSQETAK